MSRDEKRTIPFPVISLPWGAVLAVAELSGLKVFLKI